jgi:hypothetical protein
MAASPAAFGTPISLRCAQPKNEAVSRTVADLSLRCKVPLLALDREGTVVSLAAASGALYGATSPMHVSLLLKPGNSAVMPQLRVGITGASGLIGRAVTSKLRERGWLGVPLPRQPRAENLEGLDAVVNLAGEPVDGRWTESKKAAIRASRVEGTRALVAALGACSTKPRTLVSASAVGYYGDRGDEPLFESSVAGDDFLATVCREWEREAVEAEQLGIRTVILRTGIVLARDGGALPKMAHPFKFGAGGPLGNGRQFVPWIALEDIASLYLFALDRETLRGPINAVSPDVATNSRLAQAIGLALHRPAFAPAPGFALRALLGEFAGTLLASQLALPSVAAAAGYEWREKRLEIALQHILAPGAGDTPAIHTFTSEQFVPQAADAIFAFFSDARNLEAITPPSLRFKITRTGDPIREGSVIEYDLRLHGLPISWKTLIVDWDPPHGFTDLQLRGPYALWEHRHRFVPVPNGTLVTDDVSYLLPHAQLSAIAAPLVRRDVEAIFEYRRREIGRRFEGGSSQVAP